jgi:eukaryotic-like serine/threonine-protein kinase
MSEPVTEPGLIGGSTLAGYRIERKLGEGGMGAVYLASNPDLPRRDAIKVLSTELSRDPEFRARFIREADVAARLSHPNIVAVYRRGETPAGQLWIAMQFVDGQDADAALRAGTMTPQRAIAIVGQVASALDYAHGQHVVHRDVKPANFLLAHDAAEERALLADFGIARALDEIGLTASGQVMSTVAYAAPEVLAGTPVDYRADLYSLGCALFKLLTGKTPYWAAAGAPAVMLAHLQEPPPRVTDLAPGLPPALDAVIAVAMAKDPALRYRTAGELASAATVALHSQDRTVQWRIPAGARELPTTSPTPLLSAPSPGPPHPAPRRGRRRRVVAALLGIGLTVAAAVTGVVVTSRHSDPVAQAKNVTVQPVSIRDLPALLPTADQLGAAMSAAIAITGVTTGIGVDSNFLDSQDCAGPWMAAQRAAYFGSGWQALELQSADQPRPATAPGGIPVVPADSFVALLSFPVAKLATRFLDRQKAVWQKCVGRTVVFNGQDNMQLPERFGEFRVTGDNILTITHQMANLPMACGRGLTVRNNVAIDVAVCYSPKALDAAVSLVRQIADKVPQ